MSNEKANVAETNEESIKEETILLTAECQDNY